MRLRQLGTTQSIVFFAPPEVDRSIHDICEIKRHTRVNSAHCVRWLLEMTCRANEQLQALYLSQGTDFCRRTNAAFENTKFIASTKQRHAYLKVIQSKESQTLKELYGSCKGAKPQGKPSPSPTMTNPQIKKFMANLEERTQSGAGVDNGTVHSSAFEEVEQEREVEFQVEEVREIQKPTHYAAHKFPGVHRNIERFCRTGRLVGVDGYEGAFAALGRTALGREYGVHDFGSRLFVSTEFTRTIVPSDSARPNDDFFVSGRISPFSLSPLTSNIVETDGMDPLGTPNGSGAGHYCRRSRAFNPPASIS
jgi:hypothetical protein